MMLSRQIFKRKLVLPVFIFISLLAAFYFLLPKKTEAALTTSSVTMANSRLSYKAGVATGTLGSSVVTITGSGFPDNDTDHLFPGDVLCFTDAGQNGCIGNTTYTVANIVTSTSFNITVPLANNLDTSGYAVATQSGTWSVTFTTGTEIPNGGSILITIPMADSTNGNNGIPDSAATVATSGFDLRGLVAGNVTITGCTPANWTTPVVTAGSGATDHTIVIPRITGACAAPNDIEVKIEGNGIVNPAPITSGHTQGTADIYGITAATRNELDGTIESSVPRAFLVEAVLISATIDESLSFIVSGIAASTPSICGQTTSVLTTATSVPWGHLAAPNTFYYAAQQLIINTNSAGGYTVTIEENDQMGKNGNVCTGTSPSAGEYTFSAGTCIRDTICASSNCSETTASDWVTATTYPGLGYTLASQSGTDAPFFYNEKTRTYSAKQLADKQGSETAQIIMNNSGPVSGNSIYVCYKLTVPGTQPSGYYYNIAKYTATATF
jgi:hypothetical protein